MRLLLLPLALLGLAACSSGGDDAAGNIVANTVPVATPTAAPSPSGPVDTNTAPKPAELKTFRDWTVGCDNVRHCTMASLGPEGGDFPEVTMEVARDAGPRGGYAIALYSQRDAGPPPAALMIDGVRFAFAGDGMAGRAAMAIADALVNAKRVMVVDGGGATIASISPAGAAAALRYIDAAQGRAGGVTATVAKGPAQETSVPAAPAAPVVVAITPVGIAATPTTAQLATMKRIGRCEDAPAPGAEWNPEAFALGGGKTLVVLPCSAGAYNVIGALFVIDGVGVAPADIDAPSGFEATGADSQTPVHSVINGSWDAGLLTSYAKGRGLGDCGVSQSFAWDGRRLRLVEQTAMGDCRGNPNYLRTWTARVERR